MPTLISVSRISGSSGSVHWIPLTLDEARGFLISLEIAYKSTAESGSDCSSYSFTDSEKAVLKEDLFNQSTAKITKLERDHEYCIAIQASTNAGESGFSNSIKLPCKACIIIKNCKPLSLKIIVNVVSGGLLFQIKFDLFDPPESKCYNFIVSQCYYSNSEYV